MSRCRRFKVKPRLRDTAGTFVDFETWCAELRRRRTGARNSLVPTLRERLGARTLSGRSLTPAPVSRTVRHNALTIGEPGWSGLAQRAVLVEPQPSTGFASPSRATARPTVVDHAKPTRVERSGSSHSRKVSVGDVSPFQGRFQSESPP